MLRRTEQQRTRWWDGTINSVGMHLGKLQEKTLMLGKIEGKRRRRQQRMRWVDVIINSRDMSLSKLREMVKDREARCAVIHGLAKSQS